MTTPNGRPELRDRIVAPDAIALLESEHRQVERLFASFKKLGERAYAHRKAIADQICDALTVHTMIEEEIFYPAVRKFTRDNAMVDEAVVEHAGAKDLIAQLRKMQAEDDLFNAKVNVLGDQIVFHVEEEEAEMFPKIRKTGIDLEALGAQLYVRRAELTEAQSESLTDRAFHMVGALLP